MSPSLIVSPHFLSLPLYSNQLSLRIITTSRRRSFRLNATRPESTGGTAIVWFKHDLRLDDHPGLVTASRQHDLLLPLYVFDHRILSRFSDEMLELILLALKDLRNVLREQGSDLMVRFGRAEKVLQELVKEVEAISIFAEEEVEHSMRNLVDIVRETLAEASSFNENPNIMLWQSPFYDIKALKDLPESYDDFKKLRIPLASSLPCPVLSAMKMNLDWGQLPTYHQLKEFTNANPWKPEGKNTLRVTSVENILWRESLKTAESGSDDPQLKGANRKSVNGSVFVSQSGNVVGGGPTAVLDALAAYLRYLEGTARDDWQEVHARVRLAESRDGASFLALFGPALSLGIISRRRVYYEAIQYEKERNAGFLSPFGYSVGTVAAAVDAICSKEWYWLMALRSQNSNDGMFPLCIWRWKGHLVQYVAVGNDGPATLLVHGFGAFLEHYRDNIPGISGAGNRVWAITLLGFGRSEKPNVVYTELLWAELLKDFIVDVIGEPVHLVGNSIGGYVVAILAGRWPPLVKSVVLINSAGNVIPEYSFIPMSKERQTSGAAWLGARFLLFCLRSSVRNIVKTCYPTNTERADDWLINEMLRASRDPGGLVVLESIFNFDLSIPLNYLLKDLFDKILIIQGMKDPISDSRSRVAMLVEHCSGISIREIDGGHCPHDEHPEVVNSLICKWIVTMESKINTVESCC